MIVDADDGTRSIAKSLLSEIPWVTIVGETADLSRAYELVKRLMPIGVFLNLHPAVDAGLGLAEKISHNLPGTMLLVTSPNKNPEVIIRAMRSGAREFLGQPLKREEVTEAFRKLRLSQHKPGEGVAEGEVISVFGVKGGVGTTTIAINLAVNLAEETKKQVILVDLNLQLGNAALFLNIKPKYSIIDIAQRVEDLDPALLRNILPRHTSGIYLLPGPLRPEDSESMRESHLDRILTFLRSMFNYVIIDTTHLLGELTLRALDESDVILTVFTDDLAAIYNTRQCLDIFQRMDFDRDKVRLVMNRGESNRGISAKDVEQSIDYPVFWKIPNLDYPTVLSALNQGIPISTYKPRSKLSASFRDMAKHLDAHAVPEETSEEGEKKGFVKRLFSKK